MLIQANSIAKPGSQHAKFLPIIRETIAKANPSKIWKDFHESVDGVKLPVRRGVKHSYVCTLKEAKTRKLFSKKMLDSYLRENDGKTRIEMCGTDGFAYLMDWSSVPQKIYELRIDSTRITTEFLMKLKRLAMLTDLTRRNNTSLIQKVEKRIADILSDKTPTFMPLETHLVRDFANFLPAEKQVLLIGVCETLDSAIYERGFRGGIESQQEQELMGSSGFVSDEPYKPLRIIQAKLQKKKIPFAKLLAEARQARELEVFTAVELEHYGLEDNGRMLPIFFEPLDEKGDTVRDPRAIDTHNLGNLLKRYPLDEAIEKCLIPNVVKSPDYPHRRD